MNVFKKGKYFLTSYGTGVKHKIMVNHYLQNRFSKSWLLVLAVLFGFSGMAQVTIKGPACVLPGTTYHYIVHAKWDSSSTMKVCITGGKLKSGEVCSTPGKAFSSVFVTWDEVGTGTITVTSSLGTASLTVSGTKELTGGQIAAADKVQIYKKSKASYLFHCSKAVGGSCKPLYSYQWQQSMNGINWTDIEGAKSKDYQFNGSVFGSVFFRRAVTEKNSTIVGYSDIAQLMVVFPLKPGDSLFNAPVIH